MKKKLIQLLETARAWRRRKLFLFPSEAEQMVLAEAERTKKLRDALAGCVNSFCSAKSKVSNGFVELTVRAPKSAVLAPDGAAVLAVELGAALHDYAKRESERRRKA